MIFKTAMARALLLFAALLILVGCQTLPLDAKVKRSIEKMADSPRAERRAVQTIRELGLPAVPYMVKYMDDDRELPVKHIMVDLRLWEISHYNPQTVSAMLGYLIREIAAQYPDIRRKVFAIKFHPIRRDQYDEEEIAKWRVWCAEQWPDLADTCWNKDKARDSRK